MKNQKQVKGLKLQGRNTGVTEIVAAPVNRQRVERLENAANRQGVVFIKDARTNRFRLHSVYPTRKQARSVAKDLTSQGYTVLTAIKEKTTNVYTGMYLYLVENTGQQHYAIGLDKMLNLLNDLHRDDYKLYKARSRKETEGYIGFAYHSKDDKVVSTRFYATEEQATAYINKRKYADKNTIQVCKAVRYYRGFAFKHQDIDKYNRLRDAKNALNNK